MEKEEILNLFHCSFSTCAFNKKKGFKRKSLLDQHLLNCHSEKKFKCSNCGKHYAIEWQLKYHLKACGLSWTCLTCNKSYKERLSFLTHCNRHSHPLPEDAKAKNLIKNVVIKESQKKLSVLPIYLNNLNSALIVKNEEALCLPRFRPILPKNETNLNKDLNEETESNETNQSNVGLTMNRILEKNKELDFKDDSFSNLENLQQNNLIDSSCQTDNLCQCSPAAQNTQTVSYLINGQSNKKDKSTNTLAIQFPENSAKRPKTKSTVKLLESHTQTYDVCFNERPIFKNQSACTEINSDNVLNLKRKSVASETTINNLDKNYCFSNDQHDHLNQLNNNLSTFYQTLPCKDPLLTTISVQTDLDYGINSLIAGINTNQLDCFNDLENYLEFSDIQTQTNWNFNDSTTQTEDFSLDIDNIFDN